MGSSKLNGLSILRLTLLIDLIIQRIRGEIMTMLLLLKAKDPGPIAPTACEILIDYENTPLTALGLNLGALLQPSSIMLWIYLSLML